MLHKYLWIKKLDCFDITAHENKISDEYLKHACTLFYYIATHSTMKCFLADIHGMWSAKPKYMF